MNVLNRYMLDINDIKIGDELIIVDYRNEFMTRRYKHSRTYAIGNKVKVSHIDAMKCINCSKAVYRLCKSRVYVETEANCNYAVSCDIVFKKIY